MGSRTYGNGWKNPKTKQVSDDPDELPDYLNDLNAIHEAEKVLWSNDPDDESLDGMVGKYRQTLENLVIRDWNLDHDLHRWSEHATATQRCEAFLRTIEKWVTE